MANQPKNQVAKAEATQAMVYNQAEVPDYIKQDSSRGSENVTMDDLVIPRLEIAQGLSPAMKRGDPGYIDGAKLGDLNNSVTRELYGENVVVVPVYFTLQYLVWRMRRYIDPATGKEVNTDGGFFGAFNNEQDAKDRAEAEGGDANGVEVLDTPQHLCLLLNHLTGSIDEVMISLPRTKAKISRQWNSMIKLAGGDRFSRAYRLSTSLESKNGNDYYNFHVEPAGFPNKVIYEKAAALYEAVSSGDRRVVMDVSGLSDGEAGAVDNAEM